MSAITLTLETYNQLPATMRRTTPEGHEVLVNGEWRRVKWDETPKN